MDLILITIVLTTTVLVFLASKVFNLLRILWYLSKIPHRDGNFLFGGLQRMRRVKQSLGPNATVTRLYYKVLQDEGIYFQKQKHGCHFLGIINPVITCVSWTTAKDVILSSDEIDKPFQYGFLVNWLGYNLVTASGEVWRAKRRLMSKGFHTKNLKSFVPIINQHAKLLCDAIANRSNSDNSDTIIVRDFHHSMIDTTLSVVMDCIMGVNAEEDKSTYSNSLDKYVEIFVKRCISPQMWSETTFNLTSYGKQNRTYVSRMQEFTEKAIQRRLEEKSQEAKSGLQSHKRNVILDTILDTFNRDDARNEIDTLVFAGHDTTGMGIFYTLFLLGLHDEIQERLYHELLDNENVDDDNAEYDSIKNNFPFLDAVIKESLRLYPPVPFIARTLTKDMVVPAPDGCPDSKEYFMPQGSIAQFNIGVIQRDPAFYKNPDTFDPDRFLGENAEAYLSFALGPRNCIGSKFALLEMKILITHIVKRFRIKSLNMLEELEIQMEIIAKPANPNIRMEFTLR